MIAQRLARDGFTVAVQEPSRAIPGARVQALERELAAVYLECAYAAANAMSR